MALFGYVSPSEFNANSPFVFYLKDINHATLFTGRVISQ